MKLNLENKTKGKEVWEAKPIYQKQSKFANIQLYETEKNQIALVMDTYIQFVEGEDEQVYHKNFLKPLKKKKIHIKNILIGGGGDGCLARDLFKLDSSFNITIVDIDKDVIDLCKTNERLVKLNESSLLKCNIIISDIKTFILNTSNKYDVVFLDLPDPTNDKLKTLYTQSFISNIPLILKLKGLFIMQSHIRYRKRMLGLSKKYIGKDSQSFIYKMPFLGEGSFIYGFNNRNYCIDCKKLLDVRGQTKRCRSCSIKIGRNNIPNETREKIRQKIIDLWKNKDYRKKQVIAHKGKSFYNSGQFKKGVRNNPKTEFKKGQHSSLETEFKSGKEHIGYIDGRSFEKYPEEFNDNLKEKIRKRDNYTCQNCGITQEEHFIVYGQVLHVHHIDYNKFNCKEQNLITLCKRCNIKANSNRDYWQEYYKRKE